MIINDPLIAAKLRQYFIDSEGLKELIRLGEVLAIESAIKKCNGDNDKLLELVMNKPDVIGHIKNPTEQMISAANMAKVLNK